MGHLEMVFSKSWLQISSPFLREHRWNRLQFQCDILCMKLMHKNSPIARILQSILADVRLWLLANYTAAHLSVKLKKYFLWWRHLLVDKWTVLVTSAWRECSFIGITRSLLKSHRFFDPRSSVSMNLSLSCLLIMEIMTIHLWNYVTCT
jgi:hypothetical protein